MAYYDGTEHITNSSSLNILRGLGLSIEQKEGGRITIEATTTQAQSFLHAHKTGALIDICRDNGLPVQSTGFNVATLNGAGDKTWHKMGQVANGLMELSLRNGSEFGAQVIDHIKDQGKAPGAAHISFSAVAPGTLPPGMIPGQTGQKGVLYQSLGGR